MEQIVRNRDESVIEKSADALDEVQHAADSKLLRNVRAALCRIEDSSFGMCVHCEEEISPRRLAAVPWTPFCIRCQKQADRNHDDANEPFYEMLVNAA